MRRTQKEAFWMFGFLLLWFTLNLLFLTRYPLVHSDESWLGGLTRNMMARGSMSVTEPFFDLKPRYPHAIKMFFHLLQMPCIGLFGYSVFSLRLLSLLFGTATLYLFYRCAREAASFPLSLTLTAAVSVNGQLIMAAHTARQEILLLFLLLWLALILLQSRGQITPRTAVKLGILTGLGIGLHPNSFLLSAGCGVAIVLHMLAAHRLRWKPILLYGAVTGAFALLFVGISLSFDWQFVPHWLRYGDTEFDLLVPVSGKFGQVLAYLERLWNGISGTYTLPDLKPQLILCVILTVFGMLQAVRTKTHTLLTGLGLTGGALLGTILIGRYNQLSAILWMFPCLLLLAPLLAKTSFSRAAVPVLALVLSITAYGPLHAAYAWDYSRYTDQISTYVSAYTKTLANLNTGFYFDNDALLDVRNLTYLKENDMTFAQYVESRNIETIVWSDEMDYLYEHRPYFNVLYGNPRYVPEVETYLREHCTLVGSFDNTGYGMRLVQLTDESCMVRVYRVNP